MKKLSTTDELLLRYLDGELSEGERKAIERQVQQFEAVRRRLDALRFIHQRLDSSTLMTAPENFTQRVMDNLHNVPVVSPLSSKNGIWLLCGVLVATSIGVVMVDWGFFNSVNGSLSFDMVKTPEIFPQWTLPSIPYNGKWVMNFIFALNLGLAFLLLDRTILKPWFNKRSKMYF